MAGIIAKETENKYEAIKELQNLHLDATFTIGAEGGGGTTINVAVVVKQDKAATAVSSRRVLDVYLSDSSTGAGIIGTAPSSGGAIGTNGVILASVTANKYYKVLTTAAGLFDITFTEAGAKTFYLVVVMPNGRLVVSSAITFA
jgi:hypothetical protein